MEALLDFAGVSAAIVVSLGIALSLEWFALSGLLKMMPPRQPVIAADIDATELAAPGPALVPAAFSGHKRAA
ncbi:MAG: hypothetical protein ACRD59_18100 [Candidatus Acidiferrales bacterium]